MPGEKQGENTDFDLKRIDFVRKNVGQFFLLYENEY